MDHDANPYAPPKHDGVAMGPVGQPSAQLEAIRREHLNAEANVKGLGFLLYLGAAGLFLAGLAQLPEDLFVGALDLVLSVALGVGGHWLRRLDERGRLVYSIIAALSVVGALITGILEAEGNVAFEVGRMFGRVFWPLLFLAVLWSSKATTVMTPHYRDVVIPATPHIKRSTSPVLIVVLALLVLLIVVVLLANY